jgi:hypothetical protein
MWDGDMARKPLRKTVERGYGEQHRRLRAALIATYQPTDPCWRCGQPLGPDPSRIHLGHRDDRTGWAGLECRRCNVGAANKRRARLARAQRATQPTATRRSAKAHPQVEDVGVWVLLQRPPRQHTRGW